MARKNIRRKLSIQLLISPHLKNPHSISYETPETLPVTNLGPLSEVTSSAVVRKNFRRPVGDHTRKIVISRMFPEKKINKGRRLQRETL